MLFRTEITNFKVNEGVESAVGGFSYVYIILKCMSYMMCTLPWRQLLEISCRLVLGLLDVEIVNESSVSVAFLIS
jgi:hypothetical protein